MTSQPLKSLWINDIVDIVGSPQYKGSTIKRISDCGVTIAYMGGLTILSGGSPAILVRRGAFVCTGIRLKPPRKIPARAPVQLTQETDLAAALKPNA